MHYIRTRIFGFYVSKSLGWLAWLVQLACFAHKLAVTAFLFGTDRQNAALYIYGPIFATFVNFCLWVCQNWFYSGFSTELSFNLFVKRKDVLESQMARKSFTWKIMTMGRGYLPELLRFIWTFLKNVSISDQNYHILKVVSVKTKVVVRN